MKLPILNTLLLVGIFSYLIISNIDNDNNVGQAYVVTGELFNEFDYQKELDTEYQTMKDNKMKELEAFKTDVLRLEEKARHINATEEDIAQYQYTYNQYLQFEANLNNELAELNNQYGLQIWDKLNSLISDFGEENNYEVIFGAGGNGNIMYAQENKNITTELIAYCNLKYNGK